MADRTGGMVGNGDMVMVLLSPEPAKPWNQVMLRTTLKLSDSDFDRALRDLEQSKSIVLNPTTNSIAPMDRVGSGVGNGYWAGDDARYEKALRVTNDRVDIGLDDG